MSTFYIITDYDECPADNNPETSVITLLDAMYSLHDKLGGDEYTSTVQEIIESINHSFPDGEWRETSNGIAFTAV